MEKPKHTGKYGVSKYSVTYRVEGEPLIKAMHFDKPEDAKEYFNAVRVLHREQEIPVVIKLTHYPDAPNTINGAEVFDEVVITKD